MARPPNWLDQGVENPPWLDQGVFQHPPWLDPQNVWLDPQNVSCTKTSKMFRARPPKCFVYFVIIIRRCSVGRVSCRSSDLPGVIRQEAWPFYRTISGVRLCWELEEPKGPKGQSFLRKLDVIRKEASRAWLFCRTSSSVRLLGARRT